MGNNQLQIICLGSGSSGNCYLLGKENEYIMVECGLPFKTIISRLAEYNIDLEQIKGLCVSHSHKDHSLSLKEMQALDVPIFAPYLDHNENSIFKPTRWIKVRAFDVVHDVPCYGFVFLTSDNESLLFMTDTKYIEKDILKYKFNYIMIECNHIRKQLEAIMDKAIIEGNQGKLFKFRRQASFHLSLAGVKKTLSAMDLSETKAILLIHLSKECCNDYVIKNEVAKKFQKPTLVCYKNGGIN